VEKDKLEFTGERFTPECVREIWYEHYHRYAFAKRLVAGKDVLDAACGEGYGSNMLVKVAKSVTGLDIDSNTIKHAQNKYKSDNLTYIEGSCSALPFENSSFDVVISFETLEHLEHQQQMLAEFNRVLRNDGILIISTPDKKHYSDATGFVNEFHVKELYKNEFEQLLNSYWSQQVWYSQAMTFNSVMEKLDSKEMVYATDILNKQILETDKTILKPMYYIVIAAQVNIKIPELSDLHIFADKQQSVYEHYNEMIREYISVAEKYMALNKKHEKWLSTPLLGRIIRYLERDR
jgi:ubiquinone/menaquinone biosynthesis C-methylase UbiE